VTDSPDTFRQAEELINSKPQPMDIVDQLDQLRQKTSKELWDKFDWFYEGAIASADDLEPYK